MQKRKWRKWWKRSNILRCKILVFRFLYLSIDDIDSFYENENEEKKDIPKGFKDINEVIFYDDDVDFLRHHKRTKRNMEYVVNKYLIESGKQGIDSGLKENHRIMVTYTMLNKACSLLHVWWDMILFQNDLSPQGNISLSTINSNLIVVIVHNLQISL